MCIMVVSRPLGYPSWQVFSLCTFLVTIHLAKQTIASESPITITSSITDSGNAELSCTVAGLGKRRIIWTKLTEPFPLSVGTTRFIPDSTIRVTSVDNETVKLTIRGVTRHHAGEYQCRATGEEKVAKIFSLIIPADSDSTRLLPTELELTAAVGDTVVLPCHVVNLDSRQVLWKNDRNDVVSFRKKVFNGDRRFQVVHDEVYEWSLRVSKLRAEDFGQYTCMVNSRPVLTRIVTLRNSAPVQMAPILKSDSNLKSKMTVDEGEDVTFQCSFQSNPPSKVYWYIATKTGGKTTYTEVGRGNSFTLQSVTAANSGKYVCMGKNGLRPHGRGRTRLTVKAIPTTVPPTTTTFTPIGPVGPRLYHHEKKSGNHRNENHELKCKAIGWPRPTIYWRYHGTKIVNSYKYHVTEENSGRHEKTSTLLIRSLSLRDYGEYDCVARNQHGRADIKVELFETRPPWAS